MKKVLKGALKVTKWLVIAAIIFVVIGFVGPYVVEFVYDNTEHEPVVVTHETWMSVDGYTEMDYLGEQTLEETTLVETTLAETVQ